MMYGLLNEPLLEQSGAGVKGEAVNTEQTSEKFGNLSDKKVISVGKKKTLRTPHP